MGERGELGGGRVCLGAEVEVEGALGVTGSRRDGRRRCEH